MDSNAPGILTTKEQPSGAGAATESTIHTSSSSSRSGDIGTKSSDGKKKKEGYEIDAALRSLQVDRETVVDGAQVYLSSSSSSSSLSSSLSSSSSSSSLSSSSSSS